MIKKLLIRIFPLLLILVTNVSHGEINNSDDVIRVSNIYQVADSLFNRAEYSRALDVYLEARSKAPNRFNVQTEFKIAYSFYKTEKYATSAAMFRNLLDEYRFLNEYCHYFYIKSLWESDRVQAVKESKLFVDKYARHSLSDSLLIVLSDELFDMKVYKEAHKYYSESMNRNINMADPAYLRIRSAMSLYFDGKKSMALKEFNQILAKYQSSPAARELAEWLEENETAFYREQFFDVVDIYFGNQKYSRLRVMLENYIKTESDEPNKEKARYYLIKLYYAEGKYQTALYGFKDQLNMLKNKNLEPYIRLYIARIYYKQGKKQDAIDAYEDYARRYPRRRNAAESVWKAAWIYEELHEMEKAVVLYREVRTRWPRSEFAKEASFREGFTYYRLGRHPEADAVFTDIRYKRWPDLHTNRARYWSSLCMDAAGDSVSANRLRLSLAKNMWDDYYTMKSYLMQKSYIDSNWSMVKEFKNTPNPLQYYANGFANFIDQFENAFVVRELLGDEYAYAALSDIKLSAKTREEWIALAEIYKKLGAYGKAYRVYDYINKKFFGDVSFVEKSFMLKERFPFYYDNIVDKYAHRYGLEKEMLLSVMKQESVFESNVRSRANAYGLMQLMPFTAKDMARLAGVKYHSTEQLFDPEYNIHLGSLYVKQLFRQFDGRPELVLAAYNAGPNRAKRWMKIDGSDQMDVFIENIEFYETRDYVRKVMKNYWAYKLLNNNFRIEQETSYLGYSESGPVSPFK
ncbi:MAG: transglycosylase SLT domain-containing protein [Calditrichaceae bacterium]